MATVTLRNIRKKYGEVEIIKGVDLDVADREFVVFVGPSGCGKSTLLRMIAGLESITDGDLLIDGVKANDIGPADRGLAMVFQSSFDWIASRSVDADGRILRCGHRLIGKSTNMTTAATPAILPTRNGRRSR